MERSDRGMPVSFSVSDGVGPLFFFLVPGGRPWRFGVEDMSEISLAS
jgi:hypothetical protein